MDNSKGEKVNTYRGNLTSAIVFSSVTTAIFIVVVIFLFEDFNLQFWIIAAFIFLLDALVFGIMAFQATQITVTTYENGIEWRRASSYVFTTWDNIERIGSRDESESTSYGIYLRQPITPDVNGWFSKLFFSGSVDYIRLTPSVIVPTKFSVRKGNQIKLSAFAETDFGQDVSRYAPRLLEQSN